MAKYKEPIKKPIRKVVKSFAIRLDLLELLEKKVPRGERSAFMSTLIEKELEKLERKTDGYTR